MSRTANDDKADANNPNSDAYQSNQDNHANQLNPEHDAYQGSEK